MRFLLPPRGSLRPNNQVDPLRFYYVPGVGRLFRARLDAGLELLDDAKFSRVLELGYGSGVMMPTLAKLGGSLHGVDLEPPAAGLRAAMQAQGAHPQLSRANIESLPYRSGAFSCVIAFSVLEHLRRPQLERAISEAARVLEPGGIFLLGCPAVHKAMNFAFAAIGFSGIEQHHFSSIDDVRAASAPHFSEERSATMPRLLHHLVPLAWSPYSALLLRKR